MFRLQPQLEVAQRLSRGFELLDGTRGAGRRRFGRTRRNRQSDLGGLPRVGQQPLLKEFPIPVPVERFKDRLQLRFGTLLDLQV